MNATSSYRKELNTGHVCGQFWVQGSRTATASSNGQLYMHDFNLVFMANKTSAH